MQQANFGVTFIGKVQHSSHTDYTGGEKMNFVGCWPCLQRNIANCAKTQPSCSTSKRTYALPWQHPWQQLQQVWHHEWKKKSFCSNDKNNTHTARLCRWSNPPSHPPLLPYNTTMRTEWAVPFLLTTEQTDTFAAEVGHIKCFNGTAVLVQRLLRASLLEANPLEPCLLRP